MAFVVDPFICVGIVVFIIVLIIINTYIYVYWQHPDDKNQSFLPKFLIVFGLILSSMSVLMIPIDVANNGGDPLCQLENIPSGIYCGGIDFNAVWESLFCIVCFVVVILIPYATFYYEAELDNTDPDVPLGVISKTCKALQYEFVIILAFLVVMLPAYYTSSLTSIPVATNSYALSDLNLSNYTLENGPNPYNFINQVLTPNEFDSTIHTAIDTYISYNVDFAVYLIALFGWVGWWIFSIFAGVGLSNLPFDLICDFIFRPKVLDIDEIAQQELEIQNRTNDLIDIGEMLKRDRMTFMHSNPSFFTKRKRYPLDSLEINKLAQMVYILEHDIEDLAAHKNMNLEYNPLVPFAKLAAGILFSVISILWFFQIILYMIPTPPISAFLNIYLIWFDSWFPMFGNVSYALLSLYLLFCTIKGSFKIGLRFLCLKIHPMEMGKTFINSFLFNLAIILICTIPVINFCTSAFDGYARYTDAYFIFDIQIRHLYFFTIFLNNKVFTWILLLSACVKLPMLLFRPRDVKPSTEDFKQELSRRGAGYISVRGGAD